MARGVYLETLALDVRPDDHVQTRDGRWLLVSDAATVKVRPRGQRRGPKRPHRRVSFLCGRTAFIPVDAPVMLYREA